MASNLTCYLKGQDMFWPLPMMLLCNCMLLKCQSLILYVQNHNFRGKEGTFYLLECIFKLLRYWVY